ncbi:MAG TPA: UvrD-helicase domain-containing protein, partial [Acinetobacter sp.]|nr:UvrD-helicase domain-containing protein [Acinetobacter sp.]
MSSQFPVSYQPIRDIQFEGLHLIEASAGTGKTYTLSSLMVRIFLEKYLPNQVIATTFTRAAAAELKSRIRLRLVEIQQFLEPLRSVLEADIHILAAQESDPLKQHLLQNFAPRIAYACERLKLVIDQLDELFVGTLDSFSQKLLREFAFESGKIERAQITDDAKSYTRQLIHDVLREWIQAQPQQIIDALYIVGGLKGVDHFVGMVESALNFSSAQFKLPEMPKTELSQLQQWQQQARKIELIELAQYFELDGMYYSYISGTYFKKDAFYYLFSEALPQLLTGLENTDNVQIFDAHFADARKAAFNFLDKLDSQKIFKKCPANIAEDFYQHPTVLQLQSLLHAILQAQQQFEQL